jgi:hypothetical protein
MSKLHLGVMLLAATALAGCMNGRASLFATQGVQGAGITNSTNPLAGAPIGASAPVGPSGALASSGDADPPSSPTRLASAATPVSLRVSAGLAAAGSTRASTRLAANVGPIAVAGRTSLAITPSLAPASSVGASVAAVSQPLNLAATARVGARTGAKTSVAASVKVKTPVVGASLHVGP